MVVTTKDNGREMLNLRVGAANARRYFRRSMGAVELRLGDLSIQCHLTPDFWNGQPEIRDPRLGAWLKYKVARKQLNGKPVTLAMEHAGANAFTLRPVSVGSKRSVELLSVLNVQ